MDAAAAAQREAWLTVWLAITASSSSAAAAAATAEGEAGRSAGGAARITMHSGCARARAVAPMRWR